MGRPLPLVYGHKRRRGPGRCSFPLVNYFRLSLMSLRSTVSEVGALYEEGGKANDLGSDTCICRRESNVHIYHRYEGCLTVIIVGIFEAGGHEGRACRFTPSSVRRSRTVGNRRPSAGHVLGSTETCPVHTPQITTKSESTANAGEAFPPPIGISFRRRFDCDQVWIPSCGCTRIQILSHDHQTPGTQRKGITLGCLHMTDLGIMQLSSCRPKGLIVFAVLHNLVY